MTRERGDIASYSRAPVQIEDRPTDDWNSLAVDRPGGHVYQGVEWAEHRRATGWLPLFASVGDLRVLVLTRDWPVIGGASAYIPRGPAPVCPGDVLGSSLWELTTAVAARRVDVLAVDPEVPAADAEYAEWLRRAHFHPIEELQPSRHRISLPLVDADEEAVFAGISKSTRQRIRKAEDVVTNVVRYDGRVTGADVGDGFDAPSEPSDVALDRFYDLLLETGERKHFSFGPRDDFVGWWRVALRAGQLVYLEAWGVRGVPVAGLILYRHGKRLSTVHSGDHAEEREETPGALHLLRWRAIQLAIREGCTEMDLGGVDIPGIRREPREGDPIFGLYQHKMSFGGRWVELAGAHERVIRARRYRVGRIVARLSRVVRR